MSPSHATWRAALWQQPYVLLTLTTLFWAGNAIAARAAVGDVSPFALTFLRWVIVVALVFAVAGREIQAAWPVLKTRLVYLFAMGTVGFTAFNATFYVAAQYTTAINIGIIQGAMPVAVMIGAFFLFGTRVTALQIFGVMVTLAGVTVVAAAGDLNRLLALVFNIGDLIMLGATLFYASYAVFLPNKPNVAGLAFFGALAVSALVASTPLLAVEAAMGTLQWPTMMGWAIIAYVALLPSFIAQMFFIRGVELIGPGRAGLFINLVPVFAALLAVVLLGERLYPYHLAALALVLGGIWIAERGKRS